MRSTMPAMASTSTLSGSYPDSPSRMALSLPCPLPVAPSDPYSVTLHARHPRQQAALAQAQRELARGAHRPHGVRTRRADADLEQVEDAQCHAALPRLHPWRNRINKSGVFVVFAEQPRSDQPSRLSRRAPCQRSQSTSAGEHQQPGRDPLFVAMQVLEDPRHHPAGAESHQREHAGPHGRGHQVEPEEAPRVHVGEAERHRQRDAQSPQETHASARS